MRSHQIGHLSVIPAFAGMTEFIGMAESVGMTEFMGVNWFDWIPVCAGMMGKLRCESMMARWIPAFAGMTGRLRRNDLPVASIFHHISYTKLYARNSILHRISYARPQDILIHPYPSTLLSSCK